jgi:hypothetical protein
MRFFVLAMACVIVGCDTPTGGSGNTGGGDDEWLISQAGASGVKKDNRGRITYLDLSHKVVTNAHLAAIAKLLQLRVLNLSNTLVGDGGLAHLRLLTQLQVLSLSRTLVGDEGLAHLRDLKQLRIIHLANTRVTNAGLKHLAAMQSLRRISLRQADVTDAAVDKFKEAMPRVHVDD